MRDLKIFGAMKNVYIVRNASFECEEGVLGKSGGVSANFVYRRKGEAQTRCYGK